MFSLRVYVASHCPASIYSLELAGQVAALFPQAEITITDVDDPQWGDEEERQAVLFTPGYFLNGRPIYWGNPPRDELLFRLRQAARQERNDESHPTGQARLPHQH